MRKLFYRVMRVRGRWNLILILIFMSLFIHSESFGALFDGNFLVAFNNPVGGPNALAGLGPYNGFCGPPSLGQCGGWGGSQLNIGGQWIHGEIYAHFHFSADTDTKFDMGGIGYGDPGIFYAGDLLDQFDVGLTVYLNPSDEYLFTFTIPVRLTYSSPYYYPAPGSDDLVLVQHTVGMYIPDVIPNMYFSYQGNDYVLKTYSSGTMFEAMISPVPEPSTMLLLGSGLAGLVGFGRRRFKK